MPPFLRAPWPSSADSFDSDHYPVGARSAQFVQRNGGFHRPLVFSYRGRDEKLRPALDDDLRCWIFLRIRVDVQEVGSNVKRLLNRVRAPRIDLQNSIRVPDIGPAEDS